MFKKKITYVLSLIIAIVSITVVLASGKDMNINVRYGGITITLDGQKLDLQNEALIYNGTTYLPVRDVATATGKHVGWDNATKTVSLNTTPPAQQFSTETTTPKPTTQNTNTNTISKDTLKIYALDMGQADSTLIVDDGKTLLIDAGHNKHEDDILKILNKLNITKLDYVIATHPDADHIGGMDSVVDNIDIGTFYMPNDEKDTKTFKDLVSSLQARNTNVVIPTGVTKIPLGDSTVEIIAPSKEYSDSNNNSIVARIIIDDFEMLLTGDIEAQAEEDLLKRGITLKSDVLKVGHHGSKTSTSDEFLTEVSPIISIISAGEDNRYGHPHSEIINKLNNKNIKIFRTDKNGNILIETDGNIINVTSDNGQNALANAS